MSELNEQEKKLQWNRLSGLEGCDTGVTKCEVTNGERYWDLQHHKDGNHIVELEESKCGISDFTGACFLESRHLIQRKDHIFHI